MFFSWFRQLTRTQKRKIAKRELQERRLATRRKPRLESLEDRSMMTFLAPVSFPSGLSPTGIAVEDYNADGESDMAIVNSTAAGTVGSMPSNGAGKPQTSGRSAAGSREGEAARGDAHAER